MLEHEPLLLPGSERRPHHVRQRRSQPLGQAGIGRPRIHSHDLQAGPPLNQPSRRFCRDAPSSSGERDPVTEPDRMREVAVEHVDAAYSLRSPVAAPAQRANQPDAVGHQERGRLS